MLAQIRCDHRQDVGRGSMSLTLTSLKSRLWNSFCWMPRAPSAPDSSMPVGPPPTTTNVSMRRRTSGRSPCWHARTCAARVTDVQSFLQRLHAVGMFLDFLHTEVVRRRAGSENQIIIGNLAWFVSRTLRAWSTPSALAMKNSTFLFLRKNARTGYAISSVERTAVDT